MLLHTYTTLVYIDVRGRRFFLFLLKYVFWSVLEISLQHHTEHIYIYIYINYGIPKKGNAVVLQISVIKVVSIIASKWDNSQTLKKNFCNTFNTVYSLPLWTRRIPMNNNVFNFFRVNFFSFFSSPQLQKLHLAVILET